MWAIDVLEIRAAVAIATKAAVQSTPVIRELVPARIRVNEGFNQQPDGSSALAVLCERASPDTIVVFDGAELPTTFGSAQFLSATMPRELLGPGAHSVVLRRGSVESNKIDFEVVQDR